MGFSQHVHGDINVHDNLCEEANQQGQVKFKMHTTCDPAVLMQVSVMEEPSYMGSETCTEILVKKHDFK